MDVFVLMAVVGMLTALLVAGLVILVVWLLRRSAAQQPADQNSSFLPGDHT